MAEPTVQPEPPAEAALDPKVALEFLHFSGSYWRGPTARQAWILTIGLAFCLAMSTAVTVALNHWNRWFFDALEKKDVAAVWQAVLSIGGIAAVMAAVGVGIVLTRETLQIRWRAWLIDRLLERWLGDRRFYELSAGRTEPANPEYRIADDTRWATEPLTDLGIGLVIAVLNAAAFISILWSVGGSYTLAIGTTSVTIPAYMVLLAIGYGVAMSSLMLWVGRPLPGLVYTKNEREGDFRFGLMRLRDNAESVALMAGHRSEQALLGRMFTRAVTTWLEIVRRHGRVTWITNSSGPLIPIVPLIFAAPKYLAGELTLGQVTQLAGAFIAVQGAISWVVDNFNRIAEWYASARRVMDMVHACEAVEGRALARQRIAYVERTDGALAMDNVTVRDPFGTPLLEGVSLLIHPGTSLHIGGDTSIGKSTLVRALAGLWTSGSGTVGLPEGARMMIVPQKSYLPLGTVADALAYPALDQPHSEAAMVAALTTVGLGSLGASLGQAGRWDHRVSNGERQRLAIARLLLQAPDVIVLDDALSALDDASQRDLMVVLRRHLARSILVSLSQDEPPPGVHDRVVRLCRQGGTATLAETPLTATVS